MVHPSKLNKMTKEELMMPQRNSMKKLAWFMVLMISMVVSMLPIIDLFGGNNTTAGTLWVNHSPLAYFFDFCLFVCGTITFFVAIKKCEE